MPIHDWTRVDAGIFHHFHLYWIAELAKALNSGLLPPDYYALAEQVAGGLGPVVLALHLSAERSEDVPGTVAVAVSPPQVRLTVRPEEVTYARRQRTLVIRHKSGQRIVALVEILSPGNKSSQYAFRNLLNKVGAALHRGIHLLLLDLLPPTPRDPRGPHGALSDDLFGMHYQPPPDKPLTLVSYAAEPELTAYVQEVAVGDLLPEMPLFLAPEQYVNVPLETTCAQPMSTFRLPTAPFSRAPPHDRPFNGETPASAGKSARRSLAAKPVEG